jgi:hypothetical protein
MCHLLWRLMLVTPKPAQARMKDMFHISLATMDAVPNWLKADDAERLRSSIEAHRILDGEYQVNNMHT